MRTDMKAVARTVPPLPRINPVIVEALTNMLRDDSGSKKPPRSSAALLALIRALNRANLPFPTRAKAAKHARISVDTIDASLSRMLSQGYLDERVEMRPGNVKQRASVLRAKIYTLNPRVRAVADSAEKTLRGSEAVARARA